jgi:hypothetical protein
MKSTSTIYPSKVQPGKIKSGVVECYVTWNIIEKQIELDCGELQTIYEHDYAWIDWTIDNIDYINRVNGKLILTDAGIAYFEDNADDIIKWAMPSVV